jgi:ketosteroid isomerase-like protein
MSKTAAHPEECNRLLLASLESGDIETSVALYEASAVLFKKSGQTMTGHDEIRKNNAFLIALKPKFTIDFIKTTINGNGTLATNRMKASMSGTNAEGKKIDGDIYTLEVVRKQEDGSWRYVIDDPYGSMRANLEER